MGRKGFDGIGYIFYWFYAHRLELPMGRTTLVGMTVVDVGICAPLTVQTPESIIG